jgi:hypothetical protein
MSYDHIYVIPDQGKMKGGKLYDKYTNLAYFADVTGLEDKTQTGVDLEVNVTSYARGRFMRDPAPSTIPAQTRNVSMGIRQAKGAIPGYTITLDDGTERRQFQYTGGMSGLYAWLKTAATQNVDLYGPTGTPYDPIPAAAGQASTLNITQ